MDWEALGRMPSRSAQPETPRAPVLCGYKPARREALTEPRDLHQHHVLSVRPEQQSRISLGPRMAGRGGSGEGALRGPFYWGTDPPCGGSTLMTDRLPEAHLLTPAPWLRLSMSVWATHLVCGSRLKTNKLTPRDADCGAVGGQPHRLAAGP